MVLGRLPQGRVRRVPVSCGDAVLDAEGHVEAAAGSSKEKITGYETDRITEALEAFGIEGSDDFPEGSYSVAISERLIPV